MTNNFDKHAKNYDAVFTNSMIGKAQRNRVYHFLNKYILSEKKLNILELNCGTGEDANYLAKLGHQVLATDISEEMINVAKEKHQHKNLKFQQLDITKITSEIFTKKFDLIFSNFGGFNCLSKNEIANFFSVSENLLNPKGEMALVIMPKLCWWEWLYFSIKGDFKKAKRRNTDEFVYANVEGVQVPTWYYNPKEIESLANINYTKTIVKPIGIAIPPSYLEPFFTNKKWWLKLLIWKEKWLSSSFWAKYSDHFLIIFQNN